MDCRVTISDRDGLNATTNGDLNLLLDFGPEGDSDLSAIPHEAIELDLPSTPNSRDTAQRPLVWQRLDDKRASRISHTVAGGWVDDQTWSSAIELSVDAMQRLYRALAKRVVEVSKASA